MVPALALVPRHSSLAPLLPSADEGFSFSFSFSYFFHLTREAVLVSRSDTSVLWTTQVLFF